MTPDVPSGKGGSAAPALTGRRRRDRTWAEQIYGWQKTMEDTDPLMRLWREEDLSWAKNSAAIPLPGHFVLSK